LSYGLQEFNGVILGFDLRVLRLFVGGYAFCLLENCQSYRDGIVDRYVGFVGDFTGPYEGLL